MDIEEKRKAITDFCEVHDCNECPLGDIPTACWDDVDTIKRNYFILFGNGPTVNTCVSCGAEIPEGRLVCPDCEVEYCGDEGCDNCAFVHKGENEEPCVNCKNNMINDDPRRKSAPFNWKPANIGDDLDNPPENIEEQIERMKELFRTNDTIKKAIGTDPIKPEYYNDTKITPFDVIDDWGLNFYLGNAVKYIKRAGKKAGNSRLQDLKKIREYIDHEIRAEEVSE